MVLCAATHGVPPLRERSHGSVPVDIGFGFEGGALLEPLPPQDIADAATIDKSKQARTAAKPGNGVLYDVLLPALWTCGEVIEGSHIPDREKGATEAAPFLLILQIDYFFSCPIQNS